MPEQANAELPASQITRTAPEHDIVKLVECLRSGASVYQSMLAAGYSESTAKAGVRAIPDAAIELLAQKGTLLGRIGRVFDAKKRAEIVRGGLLQNVFNGEDKSVRSLELLGRDTEVGMFKPDVNATAVQINFPAGLAEMMSGMMKDVE